MVAYTGFTPPAPRLFTRGPQPTDPDPGLGAEVATLHLWLVESCVCFPDMTPEKIAEAVCLPVFAVRRKLAELGLAPDLWAAATTPAAPRRRPRGERRASALAYLKAHGPATAPDVARAAGFSPTSAAQLLKRHPKDFRVVGVKRTGRSAVADVWEAI